ncbi:hypothetical protein F5Y14DRAFT_458948 [Nemania sp. NC0429]|nr:hypothetical protein F5Y14DRAFT_458948 [Nemania sp. NC0429]
MVVASQLYTDPPPSYAEATGMATGRGGDGSGNGNSSDTSQASVRRHTTTTNTMFGPAYPPITFDASTNANVIGRSRSEGGVAQQQQQQLFPPCFDVYALGPRNLVIVGGVSLGVGRGTESPLYAVSTHSSLSLKPDVIIHSGISEDTRPLASIIHDPLGRSASIALPARATFPSLIETLESVSALPRVLSFSIDIDTTSPSSSSFPGRHREVFEWRRSSGGEKLVRVSAETAVATTTTAATRKSRRHSRSHSRGRGEGSSGSDGGRAVVAVWVGAGIFASRVLRFRFLGAAAADGGLGHRFAVMAVASALAIWHRERRVRHRGLATASF